MLFCTLDFQKLNMTLKVLNRDISITNFAITPLAVQKLSITTESKIRETNISESCSREMSESFRCHGTGYREVVTVTSHGASLGLLLPLPSSPFINSPVLHYIPFLFVFPF